MYGNLELDHFREAPGSNDSNKYVPLIFYCTDFMAERLGEHVTCSGGSLNVPNAASSIRQGKKDIKEVKVWRKKVVTLFRHSLQVFARRQGPECSKILSAFFSFLASLDGLLKPINSLHYAHTDLK